MLVLTRKSEQKIVLGKGKDAIVVTILKINGDYVSIGFEAPADVVILREEVLREIEKENEGGAIKRGAIDLKSMKNGLKLSKTRGATPNLLKGGSDKDCATEESKLPAEPPCR